MSIAELKAETERLSFAERKEQLAYLLEQNDQLRNNLPLFSGNINDTNPQRWLTLSEFASRVEAE